MDIQNTKSSPLTTKVTITLDPEDYKEKYDKELKKYGQKVQLKGFRKGKTPMGMIRKLYGRGILADVINHEVQHAIGHYLEDEKIDVLGQPIPSEDQETYDFDPVTLESFTFSFDVASQPEISLDHINKDVTSTRYLIEVTDEDVDKELEHIRNSMGTNEEPEDGVAENDIVYFNAREWAEDGLKEDGWETKFSVLVKMLNDEIKDKLIGSKPGEKLNFDIYELEKDRTQDSVKKYFLNMKEEDEDKEVGRIFEGEIEQISRRIPAEMNEEFFTNAFGNEEIKDEESAKAFIREKIEERLLQDSDALLFRDFQEYVIEKTPVELPDDFLKRLLKLQNEKVSDEDIEKDYPSFAENFRWQLVEGKVAEKEGLEVTSEEIVKHLREQVTRYLSQYGYMGDMIEQTVMNLVKDQEQVRRASAEIMTEKVMHALKDYFSIEDKTVTRDEFKELVDKKPADRQPSLF